MKLMSAGLILAMAVACASCTSESGEELRNFDIPNPLCGVELEQQLYESIYPPGDEARVDQEFAEFEGYLVATGECIVEVDGERALFIDAKPSKGSSLPPGVESYLTSEESYFDFNQYEDYGISNAETISESPNEVRVWPSFAVNHVHCTTSSIDFSGINVAIFLEWLDDNDDYSAQLAAIIEPFAEAFVSRVGPSICHATASESSET